MAWLTQFLLGRPANEISFDVNPMAMSIEEAQIAAVNRVLSGRRKKWVFCTSVPTIKINSDWFPKTQRDLFASLLSVTDTPLSFQCRNDWTMNAEVDTATGLNTVLIQQNSATRLSAALVDAGGSSVITITGVFTALTGGVGSGTNYFTGGSYSDATYTITTGGGLPSVGPVFVTYTYKGWLVQLEKIKYDAAGGRVDLMKYDYQLIGA